MDNFQKNKNNRDIDLSEFDLTEFKEYFAEEDAQREAEAKEKAEREAAEEAARIAEEERLYLEEQHKIAEEERRVSEELAARKKAEFEAREKEEARRAAERAAAAVLAAKKAEEAKAQEQKEISARLFEQANVNNEMSYDPLKVETVADSATEIEFDEFTSILDIESNSLPQIDQSQAEENNSAEFLAAEHPKKSHVATIVCFILLIATIVCSALAVWNFKRKSAPDESEITVPPVNNSQPQAFQPYYDDLTVNYNKVDFPDSINEDLKAMYSENKDLVAWLTIDGTAIDFPIVQNSDNDYYLYNHNAFNESSRYGTPFVDFRCAKNKLSKNTVIYGHRMNDDTHFGSLDSYADPEYYKKHPIIKYDTLTESYSFKIYAAFYATTQSGDDGGYVFDYYTPDMSDENFAGYIDMLNQYALYTTGAGLKKTDKIITLSTCSHVYDNLKSGGVEARCVVVGRLLRNGEDENVDTEAISINSDYRRPQIWYDKNNQINPYTSHRSWAPSK